MARPRRSVSGELSSLLAGLGTACYVVDGEGRLAYANEALGALLGTDPARLIGGRCLYHTPGPAEVEADAFLLALLCPPPEAAATGYLEGPWQPPAATAKAPHRARYLALDPSAGETSPILVIVEPGGEPAPLSPADELDPRDLHQTLARWRAELAERYRIAGLLGRSGALARARAQAHLATQAMVSVNLTGPPGSGREYLARAIHYGQGPGERPLVPLACGHLPDDLLRQTLAVLPATGGQAAGPTTLLLSDVDRLSPPAQAELWSHLTGRLASRVANGELRVISTSSRPLMQAVAAGAFLADLAWGLSTIEIELPPLMARSGDLPLLAQALLETENARGGRQLGGFNAEALDRLAAHDWPRNLDELGEVVRAAHLRAAGPLVTAADLPARLGQPPLAASAPRRADPVDLAELLADVEREVIRRTLAGVKGNKARAARQLGLTRPRLYRRMVQLGLETPPPPQPSGDGSPPPEIEFEENPDG